MADYTGYFYEYMTSRRSDYQVFLEGRDTKGDGGPDLINHPPHYVTTVPGVECIDVVKHFSFTRGNVIKYVWRAGSKGSELDDLRKARWYLDQEIADLEARQ